MTININVENQEALAKVLQQLMATGADITVNINIVASEDKVENKLGTELNSELANRINTQTIPH